MYVIECWSEGHPGWNELLGLVKELEQESWFDFQADWHQGAFVYVALVEGQPVGVLRFVLQVIGEEEDHEPVILAGRPLVEAKVLCFGVQQAWRKQGIGWALQEKAVRSAAELGCYQIRSFSSGDHPENQQLKLRLGFAVQPVLRGKDTRGAYFILPLRGPRIER